MLVAASANLVPKFGQALAEALPSASFSDLADRTGFFVDFGNRTRLYVEDYGDNLPEIGFDETEIAFIKTYFPTCQHVYSLAYRGIEAAKKAIAVLVEIQPLIVDNDFGTLLPGMDFVTKMAQQPHWNWFNDLEADALP